MTLYWKMAGIVRRMIPEQWMRAWALDHVQSLRLRLVAPALDLTIVPHKEMQITLNGATLNLRHGDIVNVKIEDRLPPPTLVPVNTAVLH